MNATCIVCGTQFECIEEINGDFAPMFRCSKCQIEYREFVAKMNNEAREKGLAKNELGQFLPEILAKQIKKNELYKTMRTTFGYGWS